VSEIDLADLTENDWRLIKEHPLYPLIAAAERRATADEIAAEIKVVRERNTFDDWMGDAARSAFAVAEEIADRVAAGPHATPPTAEGAQE